MEYRLFALLLRLGLAAIGALIAALIFWYTGSVTVVPFFPVGDVYVTTNLVIGAGLGAGLAGWLLGLRLGSAHQFHWAELPVTVGVAMLGALLGQLMLDDLLFTSIDELRTHEAPEVYGAALGATVGALLTPLAVGIWRVAHRQEP